MAIPEPPPDRGAARSPFPSVVPFRVVEERTAGGGSESGTAGGPGGDGGFRLEGRLAPMEPLAALVAAIREAGGGAEERPSAAATGDFPEGVGLSVRATPAALARARALGAPGSSGAAHLLDLLLRAIDGYSEDRPRRIAGAAGRPIPVGGRCRILGVVNVTPDSFSDGGQFDAPERAADRAHALVAEGAEMIDLGAESTRPGAAEVPEEVEWRRLGPVLARLLRGGGFPVPISVDTRHAGVARRALRAGADLINDVSGLRDPAMRRLLARTGAPAILLHMRGTPETMQRDTAYRDLRGEVFDGLARGVARAAADGVDPERILVDPGLGFGKSAAQSLELLGHLREFRSLGRPVVVGASRKSFLGRALGGVPVTERREAGIAAALLAAEAGAAWVRTHDVAPTAAALRLRDAVRGGPPPETAAAPAPR